MYRSRDVIRQTLQDFFVSLVDLANEDNVITDDEQDILDKIKEGIENLEEQLFQVLESELTQEEFKDLERQILQDIIHNTTKVAERDGIITKEESVLLKRLKEFAETGVVRDE